MKPTSQRRAGARSPVWVLAAAAALAAAFPLAISEAAETVERILVTVNDEIITSRDLQMAVEPILAQYRATMNPPEFDEKKREAERMMIEKLVEERLVRSAAKREQVTAEETEIDEMMREVKGQFPSDEAFERIVRQQGISVRQIRDRFRDQIVARKMIDRKVRSQVSVSPGETREYYDKHPEDFKAVKKARLRHILIRAGAERSFEEAAAVANTVIQELWNGQSMALLAQKYSEAVEGPEGGDMGWIEEGQLVENIDREIFKLSVGEHTQPIKSQLGFHIFKVEEIQEPQVRPFEQVKRRIETFLYRKKVAEKMEEWLKSLRKDAYIIYHTS